MLFDTKTIDDLAVRLAATIQPGFNGLKNDVEKNCKAILQGAIGKLDLVSREEFEVQKMVLAKTRAKLEELEKRVMQLEQQLTSHS